MVVMWRREVAGTVQSDPEVIQSDPVNALPHMAQRVYAIIKDNGGIRRPFIMQKLGVSDSIVKRIVAFLKEKDMIEHRGWYAYARVHGKVQSVVLTCAIIMPNVRYQDKTQQSFI